MAWRYYPVCNTPCQTGGHVQTCCRVHGFGDGYCGWGGSYASKNNLQSMNDLTAIVSNRTTKHLEPVFLNVYDLLSEYRTANCLFKYSTCHFLGAYHTSVQLYNVEYYFGDGICKSQPYSHQGRLILSKKLGMTELTQDEIEKKILFNMYDKFTRNDYDLIRRNCNHFTDIFLDRLLGIHLPMQFNRTERCIMATPCCIRTLNGMLGKDWTRPALGIRPNIKLTKCCHR
ncbi:unnamed protein product, partial [Rotaria magnacalcarata]